MLVQLRTIVLIVEVKILIHTKKAVRLLGAERVAELEASARRVMLIFLIIHCLVLFTGFFALITWLK